MKKTFLLLLCLLALGCLTGCSEVTEAAAHLADAATNTFVLQNDADDSASNLDTDADSDATADSDADIAASADSAEAEETTPISLSVACSTKGYNPYLTTDTLVEQTTGLLFENFVEISPDFEVEYRIAESITYASGSTTIVVTLRSGCYFADGTPITIDDMLQSMYAAMASETYAARFSNVWQVTASENQLFINLLTADSMFEYLLDIPVMKADDVTFTAPTASGRYTYGADGVSLTSNLFAPFPTDGPDTIQLVPVSSYDDMISALALGETNYTVQGESSTSESRISTTEHYYKTNTLLFLGANAYAENPLCNTAAGRSLLSDLIDRDALSIDTFSARVYAARGALNSFYPAATDTQSILSTTDTQALAQTMTDLGYSYNEEIGYFQNELGEHANISILIHTGNTDKSLLALALSAEWAKYGIETTIITAPDFNSFLTLLESNEFELYIGEIKLYNNIELSSFWGGSASYGIAASENLLNAYYAFRADATAAEAFETAFAAEMPYIPLLWKNGVVLTSRNANGVSASISNQFYAFGELTFSD